MKTTAHTAPAPSAVDELKEKIFGIMAFTATEREGLVDLIKRAAREMASTSEGRALHADAEDPMWTIPYELNQLEEAAKEAFNILNA